MMLTSFTNTVRFMLFFLFALGAMAMPVSSVERRDVFVPPVLYPKAGTVWAVNQKHNVTWDVSSHPVNITNKLGSLRLRKAGLATPLVLADGFDILTGRIEVTVPFVVQGSDYSLVLFGDSGNFSPTFTINSSVKY